MTGKMNEMDIPMTEDDFDKSHREWEDGKYIQDAFPMLNATQREFIMSGLSVEDQDIVFNGEGL